MSKDNVDPAEIAKFQALASRWWDKQGESKPLHDINPLRHNFIEQQVDLKGRDLADIGCGGGILSESLAKSGAIVTGVDMNHEALEVARLHLLESNLDIKYIFDTAEGLAELKPNSFDIITCMEMLEHVPDPSSVVKACATLLKPGGHLFFSTINRNPKAYLFAIIGAEYVLKLLKRGTHDYKKFIKPSELANWARPYDLEVNKILGMTYNPLTKVYSLTDDISVNYMVHMTKGKNE